VIITPQFRLAPAGQLQDSQSNPSSPPVSTAGPSSGGGDLASAFLFTFKFDLEGKCKITSEQKIAKKDIED